MTANVKKLLSLLLCLVMVAGLFPASALAETGSVRASAGGRIGDPELPVPSLEPRPFEPGEDFDEDAEEPVDYFATFDEESGINVVVEAPMGALPLLAEVRVQPVDPEAVREAVEEVMGEEQEILVAMDISFWLDQYEIEPEEPVQVRVSAPELEGATELTLVHLPDAAEPESVELIPDAELAFALGSNEIAFEAESFSVYAVLGKAPMAEEPTADGNAAPDLDFSISWTSAADASHSYDENGTLILAPQSFAGVNASSVMTISISYNASEEESLPAGAIRIEIPYTPYRDWDGGTKVARGQRVGNSNYAPAFPISWSVPAAPNESASSSFNYTVSDDGLTVILSNYKPIQGSFTFSESVNYLVCYSDVAVEPVLLEDGTLAPYSHYVNNDIEAKLYLNDQLIEEESLAVEVRTKVEQAASVTKSQGGADANNGQYMVWQDAWGARPTEFDPDDYFYIVWRVRVQRPVEKSSMPYDIELLERDNIIDVGNGERITLPAEECLVAIDYRTSDNAKSGFYGNTPPAVYEEACYPGIAGADRSRQSSILPTYLTWSRDYLSESPLDIYGFYYVLTKYPKTLLTQAQENGVDLEGDGLQITNSVDIDAHWYDGTVRPYSERKAGTTRFTLTKTGWDHNKKWDKMVSASFSGSYITAPYQGARTDYLRNEKEVSLPYYLTFSYGFFSSTVQDGVGLINPYTVRLEEWQLRMAPATARTKVAWGHRVHNEETLVPEGSYFFQDMYFTLTEYEGVCTVLDAANVSWDKGAQMANEDVAAIQVWVRLLGEADFSLYGTVTLDGAGTYNFTRADGYTGGVEAQTGIKSSNPLTLPEQVVQFRILHSTTAFSGKLDVNCKTLLQPTETMLAAVAAQAENTAWKSTVLTNDAIFQATDDTDPTLGSGEIRTVTDKSDSSQVSRSYLLNDVDFNEYAYKNRTNSRSVQNDVNGARQYVDICLAVADVFEAPSSFDSYPYRLHSGVFYDLLPPGTYTDEATVGLYIGSPVMQNILSAIDRQYYTVDLVKNWNNTGRELLIVRYSGLNNDRLSVNFRMYNDYTNIRDRGTTVVNAFGHIRLDGDDAVYNPRSPITELSAAQQNDMQQIIDVYDLDLSRMLFAQLTVNFNAVSILQTGLEKEVSSSANTSWSMENDTYAGGNYQYRISYTQTPGTRSKDLVLFDVLEDGASGTETVSQWKGEFQSIDISSITIKANASDSSARCAPVVYYAATIPTGDDLLPENLTEGGVWSTQKPEHVAAVAVDCRKDSKGNDFVLAAGTSVSFVMYMKAPDDPSLIGLPAVNEILAMMKVGAEDGGIVEQPAENRTYSVVTLLDPMLELHKSSDPVTGTQEAPAEVQVGDTVTYTLAVSAGEEAKYALTSVKVEDPIPAGMTVKVSDIRYYTNSSASLQTLGNNKLAQVALRDGTLYFTIPKLEPGVTIYLQIPAKVEALDGTDDYVVYRNQAKITGFNSDSAEIYSEETWHKAFQYFYVYHSSDNTVEKIRLTDPRVTTVSGKRAFNIVNETKEGSLYGGYYKAYPAASEGYESAALSYDETGWSKDEGGTPYGGSKALWSLEQAYTADGRSMTPVAGETYYLKEVPEQKYLQPYLHYTYKKPDGEITRAWAISAIDDLNYQQAGFVILDANNKATICDTLAVTAAGSNSTVILKPETVFQRRGVTEGYLDYLQVYDWSGEGNLLQEGGTILQYWVTPDGLMVTGVTSRVVTQITNKNTITRTDTPVKSTIETFSGN